MIILVSENIHSKNNLKLFCLLSQNTEYYLYVECLQLGNNFCRDMHSTFREHIGNFQRQMKIDMAAN